MLEYIVNIPYGPVAELCAVKRMMEDEERQAVTECLLVSQTWSRRGKI